MTKQTQLAYALALPAILIVALVVIYPLAYGIWLSFNDKTLLGGPNYSFVGLGNYVELLQDPDFLASLGVTLTFVIGSTLLQLVLGMVIALLLNQPSWGRPLWRTLILLPWAIPTIVSAIVWRWMYNNLYGVADFLLTSVHITSSYIPWLGMTSTALGAVIVSYCWRSLPFMILVILAGLQSIPEDINEAARIDGANPFQTFWRITLPNLRPVIAVGVLLAGIWSFQQFDMIWVLTNGGPAASTETLPVHIYLDAFVSGNFSHGSAMATILFVIILVLSVIYVRTFGREEL